MLEDIKRKEKLHEIMIEADFLRYEWLFIKT
jgi:hypothetical protein